MSTTLQAESFALTNIRERTVLNADVAAGATALYIESVDGLEVGNIIYVGALARETCERAVIASIPTSTSITVSSALLYAHKRFDAVTRVLGDRVRIYRAVNVDGSTPADVSFSVLAHRAINPDHPGTYYTDSTGTSGHWYKLTYWNETTDEETDLADSEAVRGDDFGHYASLGEIRADAGLENAVNLKDSYIDIQRRAAESEINAALANYFTVPFSPVPEAIHTLTVQLASAMLLYKQFADTPSKKLLEDARKALQAYADKNATITDASGADLSTTEGVTGSFGEEERMFTIGQVF